MPRSVRLRTSRTLTRDVEHLSRLRVALKLDPGLDDEEVDRAVANIDALSNSLFKFVQTILKRESESQ